MATIEELQTELAQVSAAISAAYSGQEYEIESGGTRRRLKRQNLPVLTKRKAEIEASISRLSGAGGVSYGMPV